MKSYIIFCLVLAICSFAINSCNTAYKIDGSFSNVSRNQHGGSEIRLNNRTSRFEYFRRSEGSVLEYSTGTWVGNKTEICLQGFTAENINFLDMQTKVQSFTGSHNLVSIIFPHAFLDDYISAYLLVNEDVSIPVSRDTVLTIKESITSLQVKCFLVMNGFIFRGPPSIDTLYSSEIKPGGSNNMYYSVSLKFEPRFEDFYRIEMTDTIAVRSKRRIIWNNYEYRKYRRMKE